MSNSEATKTCGVKDCKHNSVDFPNLAFFPVPKLKSDPNRRQVWLENIGRLEYFGDRRFLHVCSKHFSKQYKYYPPNSEVLQLKGNAVPTLYLPNVKADQGKNVHHKKVNKQVDLATETNENSAALSDLCKTILPKTLNQMMTLNDRLKKEFDNDRPYTEEFKNIVIRLYYENVSTYQVLQSNLKLPFVLNLPKLIPSKHEVMNDIFIQSLKAKVNHMSYDQLFCTLCVSLIKLEPNYGYNYQTDTFKGFVEVGHEVMAENYALVGMVRGLFHEWQYLAGVSIIVTLENSADFHTWIDDVILKLFAIGLNIKLVISDTQRYLISALTQKNVSLEEPYFFTNENKKIFYMFDAWHLLQLIYNDFKENDFHSSNANILKLYENDQMRKVKLAPRLTDDHLNPKPDESIMKKLRDVADIFSLETSTGLAASCELGLLEEQAMETAKFIKTLNGILSKSSNTSENMFSNSVFDEDFSTQMVNIFSGLEFIDNDFDLFQHASYICFVVTLNCLPLLRKDLAAELDTTLKTRFLNQDPIMKVIDKARFKNGIYEDPTKDELFDILKSSLVHDLRAQQITENVDLEKFMSQAQEILALRNICTDNADNGTDLIWKPVELNSFEANSLLFVTSFLLERVYKKHKHCSTFRNLASSSRINYLCEGNKRSALIPNNKLVEFVEKMDMLFVENFNKAIKGSVVRTLWDLAKEIEATDIFCTCLPISFIEEMFMSLRVHYTAKYNNELQKEKLTDVLVVSALE